MNLNSANDIRKKDENLSFSTQRIDYIDLFRAFGIILMVMGHIYFGGIFDKIIHSFHMPMFFIISGYFYKDQKIGMLIKKRFFTLIIPYLIFGIFHIIVYCIIQHEFRIEYLYRLLWDNTTLGVPISGALWFLTAMFISDITYASIQHMVNNSTVKTMIIVLISLTGIILSSFLPFKLPFALDAALVSVGLIHCGKIIREKHQEILELKIWQCLLITVFFTTLAYINGYVNMREGKYGIWPLFWINAIGLTVAWWNFFRYIGMYFNRNKIFHKLKKWLEEIGKNSIVYLCFNQLFILLNSRIIFTIIPKNNINTIALLVIKVGFLFIALFELYLLEKIICKTRLCVLIGKNL